MSSFSLESESLVDLLNATLAPYYVAWGDDDMPLPQLSVVPLQLSWLTKKAPSPD